MTRIMAWFGLTVVIGGCATTQPPLPAGTTGTDGSEAEADFAEAVALYTRGQLAWELERDRERAAALFEKAARLFPQNLTLVLRAGGSLSVLDETERLTGLFARVAPYHADSPQAQYEMGRLLWNSGERDSARLYLQEAMRLDPGDADLYLGFAFLKMQADEYAGARELFEAALPLKPDSPLPYIGLAMSALQAEDTDAALDVMNRAIEKELTDPALTQFFREFAVILISQGRFADALAPLERLQRLEPDHLDTHHMTALVYARLDRHDEAREALQRWPDADEQPAVVADFMAQIYEANDDSGRAVDYAMEAVEAADPPRAAWLRAGRLLLMENRAEDAVGVMARATDKHPDDAVAWMFRGLAYSALEKHQDAVDALEKTAVLAAAKDADEFQLPTRFDFWIGAAYERIGDYDSAERHFRRSIANHPEIHETFNYLAYMWAEKGTNLDEARELAGTALEADPENGAYLDTLGWIYYGQGRYEKALATLLRALEKEPDHPVIQDHVGDTLHALGRTKEATDYWRRSYQQDPTNEEVAEKLKRAGMDPETLPPAENQ